jgi:hypothetical protein
MINHISAGNTPGELHENLAIRGLSLQKKPKGQRPIGIPEIHNRVVSGLYMDRKKKDLRDAFSPLQQALNPRGAEIVVHVIRDHIATKGLDPKLVLLLIDFMNAFNEMMRRTFLLGLLEVVPEMGRYLIAEYRAKKKMIYDGHVIHSTKGLIQGQSEGPAACCANEDQILQEVRRLILEEDLVVALMDDISVITEEEIAIKVLEFIKTEGPKYGFQLNVPKTVVMPTCVVHGIKPEPKSPNWPKGISWIGDSDGVELGKEDKGARELGSFIGTKEFITKQVIKKIDEKIAPMAELVYKFNDGHCAWQVIKRIPALTGLDYIWRTTPIELLGEANAHYDKLIREMFERAVIGKKLTAEEWERAQLPTPVGWGLTPAWIKSLAGYTASLNSNFDEIVKLRKDSAPRTQKTLESLVDLIRSHLPAGSTFELTAKTKQSDIVAAILKKKHLRFADHEDQRIRILYKQQNDKKAQSLKTNSIRNRMVMDPAEFQVFARRSLGVDLVPEKMPCKACGKIADIKGDHDCMQDGAVIKRHNVVRDLYLKTAREGLVACRGEDTIKLIESPDYKIKNYRADIVFDDAIPGLSSRKTAVDFTFRSAFATSYQNIAEKAEGELALKGEADKVKLVQKALNNTQYDFVPLGLESMGYCSDNCKELAYYLIGQKANQQGVPFAEAASEFWYTLSFLIHRQVARNTINRYRRVTYQHEEERNDESEDLIPNSVPI